MSLAETLRRFREYFGLSEGRSFADWPNAVVVEEDPDPFPTEIAPEYLEGGDAVEPGNVKPDPEALQSNVMTMRGAGESGSPQAVAALRAIWIPWLESCAPMEDTNTELMVEDLRQALRLIDLTGSTQPQPSALPGGALIPPRDVDDAVQGQPLQGSQVELQGDLHKWLDGLIDAESKQATKATVAEASDFHLVRRRNLEALRDQLQRVEEERADFQRQLLDAVRQRESFKRYRDMLGENCESLRRRGNEWRERATQAETRIQELAEEFESQAQAIDSREGPLNDWALAERAVHRAAANYLRSLSSTEVEEAAGHDFKLAAQCPMCGQAVPELGQKPPNALSLDEATAVVAAAFSEDHDSADLDAAIKRLGEWVDAELEAKAPTSPSTPAHKEGEAK